MLPLRLKGRELLLLPHAARRIVGVHVGVVAFPEANEMPPFGPVAGTHAGDYQGACLDGGFRGSHRFRLDELAESVSAGDRFEECPGGSAVFRPEAMLDSVGAHLYGCDRFVDPGRHDVRHAGRTAAGEAEHFVGVLFIAPAFVPLQEERYSLARGSTAYIYIIMVLYIVLSTMLF